MKKILFSLILILLILFYYISSDHYHIAIEFDVYNLSVSDIDRILASNIEKNLLTVKELKDVTIFSTQNKCTIYSKIKPFVVNKEYAKNKIKDEFYLSIQDFNNIRNIKIDDEFDEKISRLIVVPYNNYDYLENKINEITTKLSNEKKLIDFRIVGLEQFSEVLYFKNSNLKKYKQTLEDLINLIKNNNLECNNTVSGYNYVLSSNIKNATDIGSLVLPFSKNDFSIKFSDVFNIKKELNVLNNGYIYYKGKKSIIYSLSKTFFYPDFFLDYKISKLNFKNIYVLNPRKYYEFEIYLDNQSSDKIKYIVSEINTKTQNAIILNSIPFNIDKHKLNLSQYHKNRILIYIPYKDRKEIIEFLNDKKIKYFTIKNKEKQICLNSLADIGSMVSKYSNYHLIIPRKSISIKYELDNFQLNRYSIETKEAFNSLIANKSYLFCDYFWHGDNKIEIYLKNKDEKDEIQIYSKKFNTLISLNEVSNKKIVSEFDTIIRKNTKFLVILKAENPSF